MVMSRPLMPLVGNRNSGLAILNYVEKQQSHSCPTGNSNLSSDSARVVVEEARRLIVPPSVCRADASTAADYR
jgi:hypothetical protein